MPTWSSSWSSRNLPCKVGPEQALARSRQDTLTPSRQAVKPHGMSARRHPHPLQRRPQPSAAQH